MFITLCFIFLFSFLVIRFFFFFQAEDGIRDFHVTGVQTCALPISFRSASDGVNNEPGLGWPIGQGGGQVPVRGGVEAVARSRSGIDTPGDPVRYEIGRASCRERVEIWVVRGTTKTKQQASLSHVSP